MKKKGFTLIELLVVISIIAMLLAILMPALSKVKKIAARVVCGTNLKGLGTAQTVYAHDYRGEYTVQGRGGGHIWDTSTTARTAGWEDPLKPWGTAGNITVGASLYLLVREADVSPKSFVCPASRQKIWDGRNPNNYDLQQMWDFGSPTWPDAASGNGPQNCVSYSYHQPYAAGASANTGTKSRYAANDQRSSAFAVMADRNPYWENPILTRDGLRDANTYVNKVAGLGMGTATDANIDTGLQRWQILINNAQPHDREGQNVMYADGSTRYENRADVSVKEDNIWTTWSGNPAQMIYRRVGANTPANVLSYTVPVGLEDSILVNDGPVVETGP